ncbi:MAG: hypothetical protein QOK02_4204 [Mycobacterium sp.]|jgi:hypothetical protein|nr:hypothetical protein [Mycobacterium sp.]
MTRAVRLEESSARQVHSILHRPPPNGASKMIAIFSETANGTVALTDGLRSVIVFRALNRQPFVERLKRRTGVVR